MLKRLHINNYALIEKVDVEFPESLTVVTGETGAGKSIFLEALSLVLGARADLSALQDKNKKCIVEAEFLVSDYKLKGFFKDNELDYQETAILRREINPEGKSRAFVNDSPVSISLLKQLSEKLIDVHSQHQTLMLNESEFQFDIIDAFAETQSLFNEYKNRFSDFNAKNKALAVLQSQELQAKKDLDYYTFLNNEFEEVDLKKGEYKNLEDESNTLENAEFIKTNLLKAAALISEGEINLLSYLNQIKQQLNALSKFGDNFKGFFERANGLYIEAKDLAGELENTESEITFDASRLSEINSKLDALNRLLKKHNVKTEEELQHVKEDIENKLQQFGSLEKEIEKLNKAIQDLQNDLLKIANELSSKRKGCISAIEKEVKNILSGLAMPNAAFKIEINTLPELTSNGLNEIRFLFSANKGNDFKELHKVASGGELSRLMLSLKALLANKKALPTIIFDEIDTGVSGDVADKIGKILVEMGRNMQVISITHLPQIASKGSFHLFVYKQDEKNKTISYIKSLKKNERIVEIAKMLSTGTPTNSAIKNAEDLLKSN